MASAAPKTLQRHRNSRGLRGWGQELLSSAPSLREAKERSRQVAPIQVASSASTDLDWCQNQGSDLIVQPGQQWIGVKMSEETPFVITQTLDGTGIY